MFKLSVAVEWENATNVRLPMREPPPGGVQGSKPYRAKGANEMAHPGVFSGFAPPPCGIISSTLFRMILLTTLNARYIHAAFGLRCLRANLGPLRDQSRIVEFDINQRPIEIVEQLLAHQPRIIGIGIYIWNARQSLEVVALLKRIAPHIIIILGGPEVSHESSAQPIVALADYTITGEADLAFANLCQSLLDGTPPTSRLIHASLPPLDALAIPYDEFTDEDVAHRVLYVEASRGCPFTCEFCLSSLDSPVRQFPLDPFLASLDRLLQRGVRQFKFVDRTFNLNPRVSTTILQFFLDRLRDGLFVHFEMVPDRLPDSLRALIVQFPPGTLQFEIGIQTFDPEVAARISRRQHYAKLEENLRFLRTATGVHIHADLIFGLPGETLESFARGFDRLVQLNPHEIQIGILKRLRGTPIVRHDAEWEMVYAADAPYEILRTRTIDFSTMQQVRRCARFWDLAANSGNFRHTVPALWGNDLSRASPFFAFLAFSDHLHTILQRTHAIPLDTLALHLADHLVATRGLTREQVHQMLRDDYAAAGRRELPKWLRPHHTPLPIPDSTSAHSISQASTPLHLPKRQARHQPLVASLPHPRPLQ